MSLRRGEPWGGPPTGPPDGSVHGGDAELAALAAHRPGVRVEFRPGRGSDLARALGLAGRPRGSPTTTVRSVEEASPRGGPATVEVPVDGLRLDVPPGMALNMVVLGTAPDRLRSWTRGAPVAVVVDGRERFRGRATTVVVANGQYLRGHDVAPRGHPGDGRAEVQVYSLGRGQRGAMRRRLPQGAHVPHPGIRELSGRHIEIRGTGRPLALEADGVAHGRRRDLVIEVAPGLLTILI